jgi:hypothetical protein
MLPNVFSSNKFDHLFVLNIADVIFEVGIPYLRSKPIEK